MPNNNNAGMHFIHYPSDRSTLHEFDYDNQVGSGIRKKNGPVKNQTSMWSADGNPVDIKANIRKYQKEKQAFAKQQAEEKKKQEIQKVAQASKPGMHFIEFSTTNSDAHTVNESKPVMKDAKKKTEGKKKVQGTKNLKGNGTKVTKQAVPKKKEVTISPNALGNDPRFKELFASLRE